MHATAYPSIAATGFLYVVHVAPASSVPNTSPARETQYTWAGSAGCSATDIMVESVEIAHHGLTRMG